MGKHNSFPVADTRHRVPFRVSDDTESQQGACLTQKVVMQLVITVGAVKLTGI